jgi:hypothetical protein
MNEPDMKVYRLAAILKKLQAPQFADLRPAGACQGADVDSEKDDMPVWAVEFNERANPH